jgi:hypothetical protein
MFGSVGANRLSVDFDAAWLGNGCTPAPAAGDRVRPLNNGPNGQLICPTPTAVCGAGTVPPIQNP